MDRLSCLPDEVICHILSFLPTKGSVQTSILSKRWRFIWALVPFLEFDFDDSPTVNIITKILLPHKHDIHTFRLVIRELDDIEEEFQSWIVNITARNIRNLSIVLDQYRFKLPQCLFTCETLVNLCLYSCGVIPMSGMYFPALKKLRLDRVRYESDESLSHLISGCPVLEELFIQGKLLGHCCVSSHTLTTLELQLKNRKISNFGVKLDTPALRYILLQCSIPDRFQVGSLDSLIEADIHLHWDELHQDNFVYSRNVLAFVSELYNVKILRLLTDPMTIIHDSAFFGSGIKFPNLTDLLLRCNSRVITSFLENANNIRLLGLQIQNAVDVDGQYSFKEPKQVPPCLISHLQRAVVLFFRCSEHEFDIVKYILMNAKVLKRIAVRPCLRELDLEEKYEAVKKLALFERGSQECQLVFD